MDACSPFSTTDEDTFQWPVCMDREDTGGEYREVEDEESRGDPDGCQTKKVECNPVLEEDWNTVVYEGTSGVDSRAVRSNEYKDGNGDDTCPFLVPGLTVFSPFRSSRGTRALFTSKWTNYAEVHTLEPATTC